MDVMTFAPFERDAQRFAKTATHRLTTIGQHGAFRKSPTPPEIESTLNEGHMRGELSAAERILKAIEDDASMDRDTIVGELHLFIMSVNNSINQKFGIGKRIDGVEFFTQKYISEQNVNFVQ